MRQTTSSVLAAVAGLLCLALLLSAYGFNGYFSELSMVTWRAESDVRVTRYTSLLTRWGELVVVHTTVANEAAREPPPARHFGFGSGRDRNPASFAPLYDTLLGRSGFGVRSRRYTRGHGTIALWIIVDQAEVPAWFAAIVLAVAPGCWMVRQAGKARRARRVSAGLCPACGYDVRASPSHCPECGTVVRRIPAAE